MIVRELQRSEPSAGPVCASEPATAPLVAPAGDDVRVALPAPLLRGIGAIVRYRTTQRYAALYPAAMRTVAVNDGAHVTTAPHVSLHKALQAVLGTRHAWLIFDAQTNEVRVLDVPGAQAILCRQSASTEPAGAAAPAAHADVT